MKTTPAISIRRAGDRQRHALTPLAPTDHMLGFVRYGMSQALPSDASPDMRAGYAEARDACIDFLTAREFT